MGLLHILNDTGKVDTSLFLGTLNFKAEKTTKKLRFSNMAEFKL